MPHTPTTALVFVYGTLKEGFPNHGLNRGRRVAGLFRTHVAMPLYVVQLPGEHRAPWLMDEPCSGYPVVGQVFSLDAAALRELDGFEEVGGPMGYMRKPIEVEPHDHSGPARAVFAYVKPSWQLPACVAVEGPFREYTLALAQGYRLDVV